MEIQEKVYSEDNDRCPECGKITALNTTPDELIEEGVKYIIFELICKAGHITYKKVLLKQ